MKKINIVFDDDYEDVDVIVIPDEIADAIQRLAQDYLFWIPPKDDPNGWVVDDGEPVLIKETTGFVEWLNKNHCIGVKSYVIEEHTSYSKHDGDVEF